MEYTKEEKAMLWLDSFSLDYPKKAALLRLFRDPYALVRGFSEREEKIREIAGDKIFARMRDSLDGGAYMRGLLGSYERENIFCAVCFSELYPESLRGIDDPPFVLYCKGNGALLRERKFAVVGSRRTNPQILKRTEDMAEGLSHAFAVVTGLAEGGDSAALAGALKNGRAVSVLAFGFSHVYPESNAALLEKVMENGLAVTEYIPSQPAKKYTFPARNRIIAGLSEGVLVVSGGEKSGTRITAEYAYGFGRDVFAFPYSIGDPSGAGCNRLIKDYAKLTENLVDITSVFGINLTEKAPEPLTADEQKVFGCIGGTPVHTSEIAQKSGVQERDLPPVLIMLAMKKRIVSCGGNRWARR